MSSPSNTSKLFQKFNTMKQQSESGGGDDINFFDMVKEVVDQNLTSIQTQVEKFKTQIKDLEQRIQTVEGIKECEGCQKSKL